MLCLIADHNNMNRSSRDHRSQSIDRSFAASESGNFNMQSSSQQDEHEQSGDHQQEASSAEQKMMARAVASPFPTVATNFSPPTAPASSGLERIGFLDAPDGRFIPPARRAFDALAETKKLQSSESLTISPAMEEKPLPKDFQPSEFTVIIGRGKKIRESQGNIHLRTLASTYLAKSSDSRQAKTEVVNSILGIIRAVCPNGGAFVRNDQGQWYEVGDRVAREKVGYVFRDLLSDKYESSCKSKTAKRKRQQQEVEQQQKQLQEEQIRTQMLQMQQRILMQHQQQQQPLNVATMASFPPRAERNVQRSFSDSGFPSLMSSVHSAPLQIDTSFLPPSLDRSTSLPFPPPAVRSLPSSPFVNQRHSFQNQQQQAQQQQLQQQQQSLQSLQQQYQSLLQQQQQQRMEMSTSTSMSVYTSPLKFDSKPRSMAAHRYTSSSDCSVASSAGGGLDDSSHASAVAAAVHSSDVKPASRSLPDVLSRVAEEEQKPPAVSRSLPDVLTGVAGQQAASADLSGLLTSPLIDCHIEGNKKDDSKQQEDEEQEDRA